MAGALGDDGLVRVDPIKFIEGELRHTTDRWVGKPFRLRPFQRDFVAELFREDAGRRVYTRALWGLPKKNGKSETLAALGAKLLVADGVYGGEVISVAGDRAQARIVFEQAKRMVQFSPRLSATLKIWRDVIEDPSTDSVWRVVSSDAPMKHGLRPSAVLFDEVHVQPSRVLWDALEPGLASREEPLMIGISTAGFDHDSLLGQLVAEGEAGEDARFLYRWIGLPDDSPLAYDSREAWLIANPALSCEEPFLVEDRLVDMARRLPENTFRRLHLNQWTEQEATWISPTAWDACSAAPDIRDGDEVVLAVDAGLKHDSTAAALGKLSDEGEFHVLWRFWLPDGKDALDLGLVEGHVRDVARRYRLRECAYDPYFFQRSAQILAAEGLPMVEFPQTNERMVPASQGVFDTIALRRLRHGADRTARKHALATVAKETERGWRIAKSSSRDRIDGTVALAMLIARLSHVEPESFAGYLSISDAPGVFD